MPTAELIAQNYVATGQVYFVFRSTGGLIGHPNTPMTTEAAYCAGDQDKFWDFHDMVFVNQIALLGDIYAKIGNTLNAYAEALGLDMESFNTCMDSRKYKDRVEQDEIDARQAGVDRTPSFLINGKLYVGALPYDDFEVAIQEALAAAGN